MALQKFIMAQVGVRGHYAVAKLLHKNNLLEKFILDTYFPKTLTTLPLIGSLFKKYSKYDPGFSRDLIISKQIDAVIFRNLLKKGEKIKATDYVRKSLSNEVIKYAKKIDNQFKFYGCDTLSLEYFEWAANKGFSCYLEQCVAPRTSQIKMWNLFHEKYGIKVSHEIEHCKYLQDIERKEWEVSKKIIVPSIYVRNELLKGNDVCDEKIELVNYGFTPHSSFETRKLALEKRFTIRESGFTCLFAGNAGYRKGIADVLLLAERLKDSDITFVIAGGLESNATSLLKNYKYNNVKYVGKLEPVKLAEQYAKADIFLFPSYLEGSALVLLEATSWGLPVVTTHQSGSVIENNVHGSICNAGDLESLEFNILQFYNNENIRYSTALNALNYSKEFTLDRYGDKLLSKLTI